MDKVGPAAKSEMTDSTNARIAGSAYFAYIAIGIPATLLFDNATRGQGTAARLAAISEHAGGIGLAIIFTLLMSFAAFLLAVTLHALTRDEDPDIAMLGLTCRVSEGVFNAIGMAAMVGLLRLGTSLAATTDSALQSLAAFLFNAVRSIPIIGAIFFGVGSTMFSWLLLRGRMVPMSLAWLGVAASALLVIVLPFQLAGFVRGPATRLVWIPMLLFELAIAAWFLLKGITRGQSRQST